MVGNTRLVHDEFMEVAAGEDFVKLVTVRRPNHRLIYDGTYGTARPRPMHG